MAPGIVDCGDWMQKSQEVFKHRKFKSFAPNPGEAIIFSGSSQWHYREAMKNATSDDFCHLIFFHFVPKGMKELVNSRRWHEQYALPNLAHLI